MSDSSQVCVSGLVLDWRGAAIQGAKVSVQVGQESQSVLSNLDGFFQLNTMPAGESTISVEVEGKEATEASLTLNPGSAFLRITPGVWNPIQLEPGFIEGTVRDDAEAFAGASVTLENVDNGTRSVTLTNDYGRFEFTPVPAGNYRIKVTHDNVILADGGINIGWMACENLAIQVGEKISRESGFFNGYAQDDDGMGIPEATIVITNVQSGVSEESKLDGSGYFEAEKGVAFGMYHIKVIRDGASLVEDRMLLHPHMYLEISTVDGIHEGGAKAAMIAEPNFNTVTVFYGTDRAPGDSELPAEYYGGGRGELTLGKCEVSIPLDHKLGELESPSFWRFEFGENPEKHVVLMSVEPQERKEFLGEIRDRITASGSRAAFVFVHGYNVTFEDAARRTGQMAYDLQFDGAPIFYSWPSKGTLKGYMADEVASQYTVPHLQEFLALLAAESGAETVHLIAHSMGNRSLTAALRELGQEEAGPTFNQIALVAPDIDADIFKRDIVPRIITSGERVTLYASATDEALDASKRVHAAPRAGDTSDGAVVVKGIDTIDVTGLDTSFLGHSYFAENSSVISDLIKLLRDGSPPVERTWLEAVPLGRLVYWRFLGHTAVTGREGGSSPR